MRHRHRNFQVTQFVKDPEVLGGIAATVSSHMHQLGKEISILQRCGHIELAVFIQGRMWV